MKIVLGCDHGGYKTKESIKNFLVEKGYEVVDQYTVSASSGYPDYRAQTIFKIICIDPAYESSSPLWIKFRDSQSR